MLQNAFHMRSLISDMWMASNRQNSPHFAPRLNLFQVRIVLTTAIPSIPSGSVGCLPGNVRYKCRCIMYFVDAISYSTIHPCTVNRRHPWGYRSATFSSAKENKKWKRYHGLFPEFSSYATSCLPSYGAINSLKLSPRLSPIMRNCGAFYRTLPMPFFCLTVHFMQNCDMGGPELGSIHFTNESQSEIVTDEVQSQLLFKRNEKQALCSRVILERCFRLPLRRQRFLATSRCRVTRYKGGRPSEASVSDVAVHF